LYNETPFFDAVIRLLKYARDCYYVTSRDDSDKTKCAVLLRRTEVPAPKFGPSHNIPRRWRCTVLNPRIESSRRNRPDVYDRARGIGGRTKTPTNRPVHRDVILLAPAIGGVVHSSLAHSLPRGERLLDQDQYYVFSHRGHRVHAPPLASFVYTYIIITYNMYVCI